MLYIILALAGSCPIHPLLLLAVMLPGMPLRDNTPNYVSQQQASSSVDDGRRPDLVANQAPPRGHTARTFMTESPVTETPTLDIPTPMSPPMRGSRRQSTRRGTHEPYNSTSEHKSARQESGPAHYEAEGVSEGIHARVWPTYNKVSREFDEDMLRQLNDDLDVVLIFVSLSVRVAIPSS